MSEKQNLRYTKLVEKAVDKNKKKIMNNFFKEVRADGFKHRVALAWAIIRRKEIRFE